MVYSIAIIPYIIAQLHILTDMQVVIRLQLTLQSAIEGNRFNDVIVLTRVLADLVNASVLVPDAIVDLFDTYIAVTAERNIPQVSLDRLRFAFFVDNLRHSIPYRTDPK